jgi:ribonuclease VapC
MDVTVSSTTMIVVDTSVLARMFLRENGYQTLQRAVFASVSAQVPVCCVVEFVALRRLGESRMAWLERFLDRESVHVVGVGPEHGELATHAALKYGKGSGHPAQLNFGDCLVYAVARYRDLPLLFVGDDFGRTDVIPALPQSITG